MFGCPETALYYTPRLGAEYVIYESADDERKEPTRKGLNGRNNNSLISRGAPAPKWMYQNFGSVRRIGRWVHKADMGRFLRSFV